MLDIGPVLGRGATGKVFQLINFDDGSTEEYVVKCIAPDSSGIVGIFEAFIMKYIHHPNLLEAEHAYIKDNMLFIVSKKARSTLAKVLSSRLGYKKRLNMGMQIALGLACLHSYGIVHGDIKPENILVMDDINCKLADFSHSQFECFESGRRCYTSGYRPPDERVTLESDIWALGTLFSKLFFCKHDKENDIDSRLQDLVVKMLKKNKRERPSIKEVAEELKDIIGDNKINIECNPKNINPIEVFYSKVKLYPDKIMGKYKNGTLSREDREEIIEEEIKVTREYDFNLFM